MKKILGIFAILLAIFFVGCPIGPPIEPEVEEYKPTDLKQAMQAQYQQQRQKSLQCLRAHRT